MDLTAILYEALKNLINDQCAFPTYLQNNHNFPYQFTNQDRRFWNPFQQPYFPPNQVSTIIIKRIYSYLYSRTRYYQL